MAVRHVSTYTGTDGAVYRRYADDDGHQADVRVRAPGPRLRTDHEADAAAARGIDSQRRTGDPSPLTIP